MEVIDLRDTPFLTLPSHLLRPLANLKEVYGDTYTLCCKVNLPQHFDSLNCHAPKAVISSCLRLIESDFHRLSLWLWASMAAVANVASIAWLVHCQTKRTLSASVSVTMLIQLSVCDACTCVYLLVIGVVDVMYSGEYFSRDHQWRSSVTCSLAGVLSVLSDHVSTLTALALAVGRISTIRDWLKRRFCGVRVMIVICALLWVLGISVAVAPLWPGLSDLGLYRHSALCAPVVISSMQILPRRQFFLGAHLSLQIILRWLTLAFLSHVLRSSCVATASNDVGDSKLEEVTFSRRVIVLVVCDTVCSLIEVLPGWLTVMSIVPVPDDVTMGGHFFARPFNVAVNPLLILFLVARNLKSKCVKAASLRTV